jgi:hypothetical protein
VIQDRALFAHKFLLSARSAMFKNMIAGLSSPVLSLEEDEPHLFHPYTSVLHMIEFLYTDTVHRFTEKTKYRVVEPKLEFPPSLKDITSNYLYRSIFMVNNDIILAL